MSEECTCYNASCHWLPLDGKGLKFGQQRFGTERTLEESQYNNQKKHSNPGSPFALTPENNPDCTIDKPSKNIILHGTYLNNHT